MDNTYNDSKIKVLKGLEGIRQRYDMYAGSKDTVSLHMVKEAIDNSIDEFMNGFSTFVEVNYDLDKNKITITDDGRGLPIGIHPTEKIPTIEVLFGSLHASGKFDKNSFKVSAGKNGIGTKVLNALSKSLIVTSIRDGYKYTMEFSKGKTISKLKKAKNNTKLKHGTIISFIPDEEILDEFVTINEDDIIKNLEERSYCNAGCKLIYKNNNKKELIFKHENGIEDLLNSLNKDPFSKPLSYVYEDNGNRFEVVMSYSNGTDEIIRSFVNGLVTSSGTHEQGFKSGLTKAVNTYIKQNDLLKKNEKDLEIKGEDVRTGLVAIINTFIQKPTFKGQVKDVLSNTEVNGFMNKITNIEFTEFLNSNENEAKKIINRIISFSKGRENANKYRNNIVKLSNNNSGLKLSSKFTDCISNNPEEKELFICEGDSAEGNIKETRDPKFQAIIPLRGKCKNSFSITDKKLLENKEYNELVKIIFGHTDIKNINYEKDVQFHNIIITSDSDDDGKHIENLLLLFFWKHFRPLIEKGYVYLALPPKYRSSINGKFIYFKNDIELAKYIDNQIKDKIKITDNKFKLKEILKYKNIYMEIIEYIFEEINISENIFNKWIKSEDLGLNIKKKVLSNDINYIGIDEGKWNSFKDKELRNFYNELLLSNEIPKNIADIISINIVYNEKEMNVTLLELFKLVDKISHLNLGYFKGLGEASAKELYDTTIDPNKRDLIQINSSNINQVDEMLSTFFSTNKTNKRKEIIKEMLS